MPLNLKLPGMGAKKAGTTGMEQTANATHTSSAAESSFTTVAASLAGGATGMPIVVRASGSVGGIVRVQIGSQSYYDIPVAPNQNPVDYPVPASAFPNRVNSVNILFENTGGAGTNLAVVVFAVD